MATKIVVLGGGVSGLSAAFYLSRGLAAKNVAYDITLLEKGRLGGWIQTEKSENSVFELGPRSLRTAGFVGKHSLRLAHDLGITEDIISVQQNSVSAQNRFIYANNRLNPLSTGFGSLFAPQPPLASSLFSIYMKGFFKKSAEGSETLYDVISSRYGEEVTQYYVDAFARGVFAADIKELSMKAAFPGLWYIFKPRKGEMPRKPQLLENIMSMSELNGIDVIRQANTERWSQWNLEGGLSDFIDALGRKCIENGVKILRDSPVEELKYQEEKKFSVKYSSKDVETGEEIQSAIVEADHVISTIPAQKLSEVLSKKSDDFSESQEELRDVASKLNQISSVDVGLVCLEFEGPTEFNLPSVGFGHLVPSCEDSKVLGIVYDSCAFPQHDRKDIPVTRLTCMMGGSWFNELFGDPDHVKVHDLEQAALESVSQQLGIHLDPLTVVSRLHRNCIPTYRTGHTDLVEGVEDSLKKQGISLHLGGLSYWGVSVNDCIYNSRVIANSLIDSLAGKSR